MPTSSIALSVTANTNRLFFSSRINPRSRSRTVTERRLRRVRPMTWHNSSMVIPDRGPNRWTWPTRLNQVGKFSLFFPIHFDIRPLFFKRAQYSTFQAQNLDETLNPAQIFIATLRYFKMEGGYKSYSESLEAKYSRDSAKKAPECSAKGVKDAEES